MKGRSSYIAAVAAFSLVLTPASFQVYGSDIADLGLMSYADQLRALGYLEAAGYKNRYWEEDFTTESLNEQAKALLGKRTERIKALEGDIQAANVAVSNYVAALRMRGVQSLQESAPESGVLRTEMERIEAEVGKSGLLEGSSATDHKGTVKLGTFRSKMEGALERAERSRTWSYHLGDQLDRVNALAGRQTTYAANTPIVETAAKTDDVAALLDTRPEILKAMHTVQARDYDKEDYNDDQILLNQEAGKMDPLNAEAIRSSDLHKAEIKFSSKAMEAEGREDHAAMAAIRDEYEGRMKRRYGYNGGTTNHLSDWNGKRMRIHEKATARTEAIARSHVYEAVRDAATKPRDKKKEDKLAKALIDQEKIDRQEEEVLGMAAAKAVDAMNYHAGSGTLAAEAAKHACIHTTAAEKKSVAGKSNEPRLEEEAQSKSEAGAPGVEQAQSEELSRYESILADLRKLEEEHTKKRDALANQVEGLRVAIEDMKGKESDITSGQVQTLTQALATRERLFNQAVAFLAREGVPVPDVRTSDDSGNRHLATAVANVPREGHGRALAERTRAYESALVKAAGKINEEITEIGHEKERISPLAQAENVDGYYDAYENMIAKLSSLDVDSQSDEAISAILGEVDSSRTKLEEKSDSESQAKRENIQKLNKLNAKLKASQARLAEIERLHKMNEGGELRAATERADKIARDLAETEEMKKEYERKLDTQKAIVAGIQNARQSREKTAASIRLLATGKIPVEATVGQDGDGNLLCENPTQESTLGTGVEGESAGSSTIPDGDSTATSGKAG